MIIRLYSGTQNGFTRDGRGRYTLDLARHPPASTQADVAIWGASLLAAAHRTFAGIVLALFAIGCSEHSGFDRTRWDAGRGKLAERNPRAYMIDSAVSAGLRPGQRREDIRALLGDPDIEDANGDIYFLGRQRWAPELHSLDIEYDDAGIATRVEVVQ